MTIQVALIEILERISAKNGAAIYISNQELTGWPMEFVLALKTAGLITQAPPAKHIICPGCEQSCSMPFTVLTNQNGESSAFIACDKRNDASRIPISLEQAEQWQTSGTSLANLLSTLLELPRPLIKSDNSFHWELGVLRGLKYSAHIVLNLDGKPLIQTAGHNLTVSELLSFRTSKFELDQRKIIHAIDNPSTTASDAVSPKERAKLIKKRVAEHKKRGRRDFIKLTANELGVTTDRIHQILRKVDES